MRGRRIIPILAAVFALLGIFLLFFAPLLKPAEKKPITAENADNVGTLLYDLVNAYENPAEEDSSRIEADLEVIREVSGEDYAVARSIADHWNAVYLDPDYRLYLFDGEEKAEVLAGAGIPDGNTHAVVVLGYELQDGEMQPELKGRCEAAAAVARQFPEAILVCSGGATGSNNPEKHTEAGLMKEYLTENCGIDAARIYTDERAMTTQENAVNTMEILQANGVRSMTIVTSAYHQRWGQAVYNAIAAVYGQQRGYPVEIVGNYSYDIEPAVPAYRNDAQIAIRQIAGILELPGDAIPPMQQPAKPGTEAVPAPEEELTPEEAAPPEEEEQPEAIPEDEMPAEEEAAAAEANGLTLDTASEEAAGSAEPERSEFAGIDELLPAA